jgi:hypothetical protein
MAKDKHEKNHRGDFEAPASQETAAVTEQVTETVATEQVIENADVAAVTAAELEGSAIGDPVQEAPAPAEATAQVTETVTATAAPAETAPAAPKVKSPSKEAIIREIMTTHATSDMWTVIDAIVADQRLIDKGGVGIDKSRARSYYTWISKLHKDSDGKEGAPGNALKGRDPRTKKAQPAAPAAPIAEAPKVDEQKAA